MRFRLTLLISLIELSLLAGSAPAQCCYIAPPPAPDMRNPGFYYTSIYGITYGPNYVVRPPFPPFQGMLLGPPPPPPAGPGGAAAVGGSLGFPSHLYARSPRDFFMVDVDPVASPYSYGGGSPLYGSGGYGGYGEGGGYGAVRGGGGVMIDIRGGGPMGAGGMAATPWSHGTAPWANGCRRTALTATTRNSPAKDRRAACVSAVRGEARHQGAVVLSRKRILSSACGLARLARWTHPFSRSV